MTRLAPPWEAGVGALFGLALLTAGSTFHLRLAPGPHTLDALLEQPMFWMLLVAVPLLGAFGWVLGDRRRDQQDVVDHWQQHATADMRALSQREWLTRAILQTAFDAVLVLDDNEIIVDANPIAARIFGYPLHELIGQSVDKVLPEQRHLGTTMAITRRTAGGEVLGKEWHTRARHAAGHRFPVDLAMVGLREPGLLLYVAREATTRVDSERARLQAARSELLATVGAQRGVRGTELLGLGTAIRTELERLFDEIDAAGSASLTSAAYTLVAHLERLEALSMWDRAEVAAPSADVDVRNMVRDTTRSLAPLARYRGNDVQLDFADDVDVLHTDAVRLAAALRSLVVEACGQTRGGLITVDVAREPGHGSDWMAFFVHADGPGLDPDRLEAVYSWLAAPTEDPGAPARQGLSIKLAHRLARALTGHVAVSSRPGDGTTFTLRVPLEPERLASPPAPAPLKLEPMP